MLYKKNKQLNKVTTLFIALILTLSACNKDNDHISADFEITQEIDRVFLKYKSLNGEESDTGGSISWSSSATDINIQKAGSNLYFFIYPERKNPDVVDITMNIAGKSNGITKSVIIPTLSNYQRFGLGASVTKELSNNVDYEWYVDQGNTGEYSLINCGPACTAMVLKWYDQSSPYTTEDLRNKQGHDKWWSAGTANDDIDKILIETRVPYHYIYLGDKSDIIAELDKGNIIVICLDIYYVRQQFLPEWKIDKFYKTNSNGSGHFIIIKGYKIVDTNYLLEVYDPWSLNAKYSNNEFKGKDRYYRVEDIMTATDKWWKRALVFSQKNKRQTRASNHWIDPTLGESSPTPLNIISID